MVGDVTSDPAACSDVAAIRLRKRLKGKYRDCPNYIEAVHRLDVRRAEVRAAKDDGRPYRKPKERSEEAERAKEAAATDRAPAGVRGSVQEVPSGAWRRLRPPHGR